MFPLDIMEITDAMRSQSPTQPVWAEVLDNLRAAQANQGVGSAGAFATIAARLANFDTVVAGMALATLANLRIIPSDTTPDDICTITIDTIAVGDATNGYSILQAVSGSCNAGQQQLNGRTKASRDINSKYHLWVGHNPTTGGVGFAFDPAPDRASLDLSYAGFNGYTRWRRIGMRVNDGDADFLRAYTIDRWTRYDISEALQTVVNGVSPNASPQTVSLATLVPTTSRLVRIGGHLVDPNLDGALLVRPNGGAGEWGLCAAEAPDGRTRGIIEVDTNDAREIQWWTSGPTTGQVYLRVLGYFDPI